MSNAPLLKENQPSTDDDDHDGILFRRYQPKDHAKIFVKSFSVAWNPTAPQHGVPSVLVAI
jgi:hypothetical protein